MTGRKDSSQVDGTGSDCISQVHVSIRRLELWSRYMGSNFVRWTAVLELAESGRNICSQQRF